MDIKVDTIQTARKIPAYMSIPQLQQATTQYDHLQWLKGCIMMGWPENRDQMPQNMKRYWMFQDDMAVIDRGIMKGRCVVIPEVLKTQALYQLHNNHMGIEKIQAQVTQISLLG